MTSAWDSCANRPEVEISATKPLAMQRLSPKADGDLTIFIRCRVVFYPDRVGDRQIPAAEIVLSDREGIIAVGKKWVPIVPQLWLEGRRRVGETDKARRPGESGFSIRQTK